MIIMMMNMIMMNLIDHDEHDLTCANPKLQPLTAKMLQAVVTMKVGLVPRMVAVHN